MHLLALLALPFAAPQLSDLLVAQDAVEAPAVQAPEVQDSVQTFTGTYKVKGSAEAQRQKLDKLAEEAAADFPFYAKSIAEGRLKEAITMCEVYDIDLQADTWMNKCDALPALNRPIDGSATTWQGANGPVTTTIKRMDNTVVLRLKTESGTRVNTFKFHDDDTMTLHVTLVSDSLEKPVKWVIPYVKG